jgi:hypothetical protein
LGLRGEARTGRIAGNGGPKGVGRSFPSKQASRVGSAAATGRPAGDAAKPGAHTAAGGRGSCSCGVLLRIGAWLVTK